MKKLIYLVFVFFLVNGMSRQELRSLYQDDQHKWIAPVQQDKCGICLQPEGKLRSLACHKSHRFHSNCIEQWRKQKSECPVCRAVIEDSILCTCLKSAAKPSVLIMLAFTCASAFRTLQDYKIMGDFFSGSYETQCSVCIGLAVSSACALCFGMRLHQLNDPKDN